MNLIYFTKDAYMCLLRDVNNNEKNYYSDDDWLDDYFKKQGIFEYYNESSVDLQIPGELYAPDDEDQSQYDIANVKSFYDALKTLSPLQASDPLLWSALCHISFKSYVLKRWRKKQDDSVSIDKRFFAKDNKTSLLYYNALSRLWWSGYLTYDEEMIATNPWHLTEILFSAQQIQKDLTDQPFSMNRTIVKGLLSALKRIQNERNSNCTPLFRLCCDSYINHYGAVSILDTLSAQEIEAIAYDFMKKH